MVFGLPCTGITELTFLEPVPKPYKPFISREAESLLENDESEENIIDSREKWWKRRDWW